MRYIIISITSIFFVFFAVIPGISQQLEELEATYKKDIKKVRQYPGNEKRIADLAVSYGDITNAEEELINSLRATGQPDIWYNIYRIYQKMDDRQKEVMALPDATLKRLNFTSRDYSDEVTENKNKAEAYLYAHASKLIGEGKPEAARLAYHDLVLLAGLTDEYKDLDVLIRKAVLNGATKIEYELYNKTGSDLDAKIVDELSVAIYAYRKTRLEKAGSESPEDSFPFIIRIYLKEIKVSPDRVKKSNYGEERDIYRDGVVIDTIRCSVDQIKQVKGAVLSGRIDIYDANLKTVINTIPMTAESMFVHTYATMKGNPDAAGDDTRIMLSQKEVEFPTNEAIVMDAVTEFTKQAIMVLLPSSP